MNRIIKLGISLVLFSTFLMPRAVAFAKDAEAGAAGALTTFTQKESDERVTRLQRFFRENNSPFEPVAEAFVDAADRNNLDWKLVAAIGGLESSFGKHIPSGSYNAWGWGIPTGAQSGIAFKNWEAGIHTVSEGLRKNYLDKGLVGLAEIGSRYAASPTWAYRVGYFMEKIDSFHPADMSSLSISL